MSLEKVLMKLKSSGVSKVAELEKIINRMQLRRFGDEGMIQSIGYGYYAHPSIDPFHAYLFVVSKYYPKAVISGTTALALYKLTDERIDLIEVEIPNTTNIKNNIMKVHRVAKNKMVGVVRLEINGQKIRVYSPERALCGLYKQAADGPAFLKALKRYVRSGQIDSESIAKYDRLLKTRVLKALSQEMADG